MVDPVTVLNRVWSRLAIRAFFFLEATGAFQKLPKYLLKSPTSLIFRCSWTVALNFAALRLHC